MPSRAVLPHDRQVASDHELSSRVMTHGGRAAAEALLRELATAAGLRTYRLDWGAAGDSWRVSAIHCASDGCWKSFSTSVSARELAEAAIDRDACRTLVTRLATSLTLKEFRRE